MTDICIFPTLVKLAIIPMYKKGQKNWREYTHLQVSFQISQKFAKILSLSQCQITFDSQNFHAVLGKASPEDKGKTFAGLLTDLPWAFDCLPHDLIIVKRKTDEFSFSITRLNKAWSFNIKQRRKWEKSFYSFHRVLSWRVFFPPSKVWSMLHHMSVGASLE